MEKKTVASGKKLPSRLSRWFRIKLGEPLAVFLDDSFQRSGKAKQDPRIHAIAALVRQAGDPQHSCKRTSTWPYMQDVLELTMTVRPIVIPRPKPVADHLGIGEKHLSRICLEYTSYPAKAILEAVSLWQARTLLRSAALRAQEQLNTMTAIGQRFGWQKFQNFRARYINFFGHPPKDDWVS